jgi:hypothetical protein
MRELGLTKVYGLMARPPAEIDAFLGQAHAVRRGLVKTPLQMTFAEMMAVLNGPPKVDTAPEKMVKAVKRFATRLLKAVEATLDAPDLADSEEFHERLEAIADDVAQVVALAPKSLIARRVT